VVFDCREVEQSVLGLKTSDKEIMIEHFESVATSIGLLHVLYTIISKYLIVGIFKRSDMFTCVGIDRIQLHPPHSPVDLYK
jgi:hypothetical protein